MTIRKPERDAILTGDASRLAEARGPYLVWVIAREALLRLVSDEVLPLAGNIAFRFILAIFPFLIFLTSLAGYFGSPELADKAVNFLLGVAPKEIIQGIAPEIRTLLTVTRSDLLSVGVLLTIWAASGGVDSLRVGLNRAYDVEERRPMPLLFLVNVLFVVVWAAALMLLAVLIVFAPVMLTFIQTHFPGSEALSQSIDNVRYPVAIIVLLVALLAAHLFLPARWHLPDLLPGILLTLLLWLLLAVGYSYFITHFATFASTYAGLAGLIIAIYFVYLSALGFILGGEVNRALRLRRKARAGMLGAPPSGREKTGRLFDFFH
jgi:membrane protein